jgi:LytS/YehU family sensor histidine kinase
MSPLSFTGLINNVALLVAMGVLYCYVRSFKYSGQWPAKLISGLFLGLVSVGVMMNPWELVPGVIFDSRSVLLSVGGLFLGLAPMLVAGLIASVYRILIGGDGAFTGVAVIVSSCAIGVIWAYLRKKPPSRSVTGNTMPLALSCTSTCCYGCSAFQARRIWKSSNPCQHLF